MKMQIPFCRDETLTKGSQNISLLRAEVSAQLMMQQIRNLQPFNVVLRSLQFSWSYIDNDVDILNSLNAALS